MVQAFVGLGSNLGNGRRNLLAAWDMLGRVDGVSCLCISDPYRTEPVGLDTEHWFTNAVGLAETTLSPADFLHGLLRIEAALGRDRKQGLDRIIDLDLLYYGDSILNEPGLVVPHPEIQKRTFVLLPLMELAPTRIHPVLERTTGEMLQELAPNHEARRLCWQDEEEGV